MGYIRFGFMISIFFITQYEVRGPVCRAVDGQCLSDAESLEKYHMAVNRQAAQSRISRSVKHPFPGATIDLSGVAGNHLRE
jgi:hypothetical protein